MYGLWYATSGHDGSVSAAQWSLTGIFLCFVAATTLFHVVWRRTPELTDLALMSLERSGLLLCQLRSPVGGLPGLAGALQCGMSVLYAMTGYLAWRRSEDNKRLSLFAFGIAIVFLTIAIPVQLHRSYASWITAAWAVEGATLIWMAVRQNMPKWQLWGLGAFAMALIGLFTFNAAITRAVPPLHQRYVLGFFHKHPGLLCGACFLRRDEDALQPWFFPAMMLTASVLTSGCSVARLWVPRGAGSLMRTRRARHSCEFGTSRMPDHSGWSVYGWSMDSGLLLAGARKNWYWLRVRLRSGGSRLCG